MSARTSLGWSHAQRIRPIVGPYDKWFLASCTLLCCALSAFLPASTQALAAERESARARERERGRKGGGGGGEEGGIAGACAALEGAKRAEADPLHAAHTFAPLNLWLESNHDEEKGVTYVWPR